MEESSVVKHTLIWTSLLVAISSVVTVLTLLEPPANLTQAKHKLAQSTREPSSQDIVLNEGDLKKEIHITCAQKGDESYSQLAAQVRITGDNCKSKSLTEVLKTVSVTNESNSFSATIFVVEEDSFTTDYVSLKPGENQIRITQQNAVGEKLVRSFILVR